MHGETMKSVLSILLRLTTASFDNSVILKHETRNFISPSRSLCDVSDGSTKLSVQVTEIYRVFQEECARLREGVPYVKVYRYNPKHLCPKLSGYGDNGQRKV